jgi:hypothetical protein
MRRFAVLALLALGLSQAPAAASPGHSARYTARPPLASAYWDGFKEHWGGMLKKQNGVVMVALGVGAVSLFIITRGKWLKN